MNFKFQSSFVSVDAAKSLKEVGFSEPCLFSYSEGVGVTAVVSSKCSGNTEFSIDDFLIDGSGLFIGIPTYTQVFGWYLSKGYSTKIEDKGDRYKAVLYFDGKKIKTHKYLESYEEALDFLLWELIARSYPNSYLVYEEAPRPKMTIKDYSKEYDPIYEYYKASWENSKNRSIDSLESEKEKELKKI
jgi:hypothetical protein